RRQRQMCIRDSAYNQQFAAPLDDNEVIGIAKSIAKWTFNIFSKEKFEAYVRDSHSSKIQSIRGRKGGLISKRGVSPRSQRTSQPWPVSYTHLTLPTS
ncbi:hypothetical protein DNP21_24985, partial [Salmonella enterica subsp. enterica serovar Panama]